MLKIFSENNLKKIIYGLSILLAFTPAIYTAQTVYPYGITKTIIFRIIVSLMLGFYLLLISKDKTYLPKKNKTIL